MKTTPTSNPVAGETSAAAGSTDPAADHAGAGTRPDPRATGLLARPEPLTWSFTGDSVTAAGWHTWGSRGYAELFHERLRELGRVRDAVINTAVSGWRIDDIRDELERICLRHAPDVVVIGTGLNDTRGGADGVAAFGATYRAVIDRLHQESAAVVVVQTPNDTLPTAPNHVVAHLDAYAEEIRSIAAEAEVVFIDHLAHWRATAENTTFHWLGHGCHPNAYGHRAMARTFMRAFGAWDPDGSRVARLTLP